MEANLKRVAPGCRAACNGRPGVEMDELIAAFKRLRAEGYTVEALYRIAGDAEHVAKLFPRQSMGALLATAAAMVSEGCAACAVTTVIEEEHAQVSEGRLADAFILGKNVQDR